MNRAVLILFALPVFFGCCRQPEKTDKAIGFELIPISKTALYDSTSVFFGNFGRYPRDAAAAPIGIFDSGTGGLTVMEAIVTLDLFNNATGKEEPDGICDFAGESFVYLADQANMPYGNYSTENKTDYLRELIVQDALFLMGHQVKTIVVACNTATATGLPDIQALLERSQTGVTATGVIHAGVKGALETLSKTESGSIGVMATVGTIRTMGYERTIRELAKAMGYTGTLQVINQPAMGFAEAVDEEPDFIARDATQPRDNYRGPALHHPDYSIHPKLLDAYRFDFTGNGMLCTGAAGDYTRLQLNFAPNYARYHLLSLIEKLRATPDPQPLKALIMGCTHYPYHRETLQQMLCELRNYQQDGCFPYRDLIAADAVLVDPAVHTARELYILLRDRKMLNRNSSDMRYGFYISIPNSDLPGVALESIHGDLSETTAAPPGRFTYDFKYGRNPGTSLEYVRIVPFSSDNMDGETQKRFRTSIPVTCSLIPNL